METGASVPGYSGGFAAWAVVSDLDLFGSQTVPVWNVFISRARRTGYLLTHSRWVADPGCGAERLAEGLFGMGLDAEKRIRSHGLEGCGLRAKCGNRAQRPRLQWRLCRLGRGFVFGFL